MGRILARRARFALWLAALLLAFPSLTRAQQDAQTQAPSSTGSSSANGDSQSAPLPNPPVITSLETGQALSGKNGPLPAGRAFPLLSLGHLTLLSLSTFYEYDSNLEFTPQPQAASALAFQGLLHYSIGSERTALDLQYRPYVLVTQGNSGDALAAQADLAANSLDLHTHHYLSPLWLLNLDDHFQYAPARGSPIDPTVRPDLSGTGIISRDPFLFNGQTTLNNTAVIQVRYSDEYNTLTFQGQYQYVETWTPPSSTNSTTPATPAPTVSQHSSTGGGGISWSRKLDTNKLFGVSYRYDRQLISGSTDQSQYNQSQYNSLQLNYSQQIRPSLQLVLAGGPSWQVPTKGATRLTFVGSAEILKNFHASSVVLSWARNYDYIGVVSNSYYTRYDAFYTRSLGRRAEFSVGAGYAQQGFTKLPEFDGREEWARGSYFLNEKWSAFLTFANVAGQGGIYPYANRNLLIFGVRWAYHPYM